MPDISALYLESGVTAVFVHKVKGNKKARIPGSFGVFFSWMLIGISIFSTTYNRICIHEYEKKIYICILKLEQPKQKRRNHLYFLGQRHCCKIIM